jgi:hypothetical protein
MNTNPVPSNDVKNPPAEGGVPPVAREASVSTSASVSAASVAPAPKKDHKKVTAFLEIPSIPYPWMGFAAVVGAAIIFLTGAWYVFVLYERVGEKVAHVASEKLRADSLGELERLASTTAPSRAALPGYFVHEAELVDYIEMLEATAVARNVNLDITGLDADSKPDKAGNGAAAVAAVIKTASSSRAAAPKFADAHLRFGLSGSWNNVLGMYRFIETLPLAMTLKEVHMRVVDTASNVGGGFGMSGDELPVGPRSALVPPPGRRAASAYTAPGTQWILQGEMVIKIAL